MRDPNKAARVAANDLKELALVCHKPSRKRWLKDQVVRATRRALKAAH